MSAPDQVNTCLVLRTVALLIHADAHAVRLPHWLDPKYKLIRRSAGRRALLRNLEAATHRIGA
jgi:hypothetical protein